MRIGIDVGGTSTDAVLMDAGLVLATVKEPTTGDVLGGIQRALRALLAASGADPARVGAVMVGTTHFTNALAQATGLLEVGVVRIGLPAGRALPPMVDWPDRLRAQVGEHVFQCRGGHEFDGTRLAPLDRDALRRIADRIASSGLRSIAISSIFSPANDECEREAAALLGELVPGAVVSCSSEIGRFGLLERENATIVNASLADLATRITGALRTALAEAGIGAPLYLSQNDGTLMTADYAERHPVATFASGPTNSMRGAALLSGRHDCAVIDVGGTTSDVSMLVRGFPRDAQATVELAGVRVNFRMPDLLSIGVGGGSIVAGDGGVGPLSVGYQLAERALVFGGSTLTATDVAVAAGRAEVGDPALVAGLDRGLVRTVVGRIESALAAALDRVKLGAGSVPVVLVGGGCILLEDRLPGASQLDRPRHHAVANAVGAAIAQAGGEIDQLFSIGPGLTRAAALDRARELAVERAVAAGAVPDSVQVVDVEERALNYVPGNAMRIRARAVGDLDIKEERLASHR